MKRITAILLSLCLVLCSCGKGNEPLAKRELIAQTKADASEPPKPIEKTIPIKYLGENLEIIEETSIDVKGVESETTISINYLKDTIPEDTCDIVDAHYWKDGIEKPLTEKPISLDEVDMIELVCWGKEVNRSSTPSPTPSATPSPTPAPSSATKSSPSASKSPEPTASSSPKPSDPSKKPEEKKINNKYSYFKIACVVVAVIVATILIIKMARKCKGKTLARSGSDGEESGSEELIPRQPVKHKNKEGSDGYYYDEEDQEEGTKEKEEEKEEEETRDEAEASRALQRVEKVEQLTLQAGHTYEEARAVSQQALDRAIAEGWQAQQALDRARAVSQQALDRAIAEGWQAQQAYEEVIAVSQQAQQAYEEARAVSQQVQQAYEEARAVSQQAQQVLQEVRAEARERQEYERAIAIGQRTVEIFQEAKEAKQRTIQSLQRDIERGIQMLREIRAEGQQAIQLLQRDIAVSQQQFQQGQKGTKEEEQKTEQPIDKKEAEPDARVSAEGRPSNPEPAQEPDVDRLQTEVSIGMSNICMVNISAVANLIISINQQGELNQVPDNIQQGAYGLLIACIRPYKVETFPVIVKAINVLGRLEDAREVIEQKCTKHNLVLDAILAEQQP